MEKQIVKPSADIYANKETATFKLNLPGIEKEDITLNYENEVITIKAGSKFSENENGSVAYRDFAPRNFERAFRVGKN